MPRSPAAITSACAASLQRVLIVDSLTLTLPIAVDIEVRDDPQDPCLEVRSIEPIIRLVSADNGFLCEILGFLSRPGKTQSGSENRREHLLRLPLESVFLIPLAEEHGGASVPFGQFNHVG